MNIGQLLLKWEFDPNWFKYIVIQLQIYGRAKLVSFHKEKAVIEQNNRNERYH